MAETMALQANALTTLDRLKSFLCVPADEEDPERDAVLTQLCLQRPSCLRELYRIPGMTQTKAEAYGKDFLKVIAAFS